MIENRKAERMTIDELRALVRFANDENESLWTGHGTGAPDDIEADAQMALDIYHASSIWDGVRAWLENDAQAYATLTAIKAGNAERARRKS